MVLISPNTDLNKVLEKVELFIFDSDGVLMEDGEPIDGAKELIDFLRGKNKEMVVLSNNSTKHPLTMKEIYHSKGLTIDTFINSSIVTVDYCLKNKINRVFVVGESGLIELLGENGLTYTNQRVDAVIVGMDRDLTYQKLAIATRLILNGARFIATNPDPSFPTPRGPEPGAGSMIAALVASTGKNPEIILGKPEVFGYNLVLEKFNITPDQALMIGDRYETDILGAINANIPALIVNTGIAKTRDNPGKFGTHPPIKFIKSLRDLIK